MDCCASLARDENFQVDFHVELVPISASGIALRNLPLRHHSFGKPGTQVRDIEVNTQALLICGLLAVALESSPQREAGVSASPSCIAWPACTARRWFKAELHGADDIAIHARVMIYTNRHSLNIWPGLTDSRQNVPTRNFSLEVEAESMLDVFDDLCPSSAASSRRQAR